jgi:hypothetical protein
MLPETVQLISMCEYQSGAIPWSQSTQKMLNKLDCFIAYVNMFVLVKLTGFIQLVLMKLTQLRPGANVVKLLCPQFKDFRT